MLSFPFLHLKVRLADRGFLLLAPRASSRTTELLYARRSPCRRIPMPTRCLGYHSLDLCLRILLDHLLETFTLPSILESGYTD